MVAWCIRQGGAGFIIKSRILKSGYCASCMIEWRLCGICQTVEARTGWGMHIVVGVARRHRDLPATYVPKPQPLEKADEGLRTVFRQAIEGGLIPSFAKLKRPITPSNLMSKVIPRVLLAHPLKSDRAVSGHYSAQCGRGWLGLRGIWRGCGIRASAIRSSRT